MWLLEFYTTVHHSRGEQTPFMRNNLVGTLNVFIGQIIFSNQSYKKSPSEEGVRL
jgi:hypothetical protein